MSQIKLSDIKAARHGWEIDYLLDLVERLGKVLKWSLEEIESDALMSEDGNMLHHDCEYMSNPEAGKCDFHDGYAGARALLEELEK